MQYVSVVKDCRVNRAVDSALPGVLMVHDMLITDRAVVYDHPVSVDFDLALAGIKVELFHDSSHMVVIWTGGTDRRFDFGGWWYAEFVGDHGAGMPGVGVVAWLEQPHRHRHVDVGAQRHHAQWQPEHLGFHLQPHWHEDLRGNNDWSEDDRSGHLRGEHHRLGHLRAGTGRLRCDRGQPDR